MANDDAERREAAQWKKKYYDSLGELEGKERQWSEAEAILRQGLSRLTLAAEPGLPQLERQLDELRNALRRGRDSLALRGLLDGLSETILALDQQRRESASRPGPVEALAQLVDTVAWPRGMNYKARALKKQLKRGGDDVGGLVKSFSGLLGEAFDVLKTPADDPNASQTRRRGLLAGLFGDKEDKPEQATSAASAPQGLSSNPPESIQQPTAASPPSTLSAAAAPSPDASTAPTPPPHPSAARVEPAPPPAQSTAGTRANMVSLSEADATEVEVARIGDLLVELLDRVGLPDELESAAQGIRHRLMDAPDLGVIDRSVVEIAGLIAEARARADAEKRELELFLKQLTLRLQELDVAFQENFALSEASRADGRELDAAVQAEVRGMQDSVQSARELDALKRDIQSRLAHIDEHLSQFRSADELRQHEAEAQVEALTARLAEMESEAEGLRKSVREKHLLTLRDPLTGLANRIAYQERIELETARSKRYSSPLFLMVWDVDRFKAINDLYGHQAGDRVLMVIAKRLAESVRETDFIARYGGEEFVIIMPEIDREGALQAAEKLRQIVATCDFHYRDQAVPITASCGLAEYGAKESISSWFERADAALYRAKDQGRNRVMLAK